MIKGMVFDIGGVLIECKIRSFFASFEKEAGISKEGMYSKIIMSKDWWEFEKGNISEEELKERVIMKGFSREFVDKIAGSWRSVLKPIPETMEVAKALKGRYRLWALSNVDYETVAIWRASGIYEIFDGVVLSCEVHMRKPEKEIYQYVLDKMGLKPEETVFIDNYPNNLPAAKDIGINTILYENAEQLKRDLERFGIKV